MNWIFFIPFTIAFYYMVGSVFASFLGWKRREEQINSAKIPKRFKKSCFFENCRFSTIPIYWVVVITCADYFGDIWVMLDWMGKNETRNLGSISLTILMLQRIISALVFAQEFGWRIGIYQLFDLQLFNLISVSVQYQRPVYGLKKYKVIEGLMESFPQLMLQTYYLAGYDDIENGYLFHLSILTSLLSLSMCYLISDIYGIKRPAMHSNSIVIGQTRCIKKEKHWSLFCYGCLGFWRVGEIAARISICVTFTRIVSAKLGTLGISFVLLVSNWILIWLYDETIKATIFYHKKSEANIVRGSKGMSGLKVIPSCCRKTGDDKKSTNLKDKWSSKSMSETWDSVIRTSADRTETGDREMKTRDREMSTNLKDKWGSKSMGETQDNVIITSADRTETKEISMDTQIQLNVDAKPKPLQSEKYVRRRSTFKRCWDIFTEMLSKVRKIIFMTTNYVGVGIFASLALPSLYPSSYVRLYYLFKVVFEICLIGWCIAETTKEDGHDPLDVHHIAGHNHVITDIMYYWIIGTISCLTGGLLSYFFVLDSDGYKRSLEPDDIFLFDMMKAGKYVYLDRAIGHEVCTLEDIILRTVQKRDKNYLSCEDCSHLLCEMLRNGVVELGPKYAKVQNRKSNSWKNKNNLVSALLRDFDESPFTTKESKFAMLVFGNLLREGSPVHFSYEDLRRAGVSLTFLRFHLEVPDKYFNKNGIFDCTADELHGANFDLLFCLNRNFSCKELVAAGYREKHVNYLFDDYKNYELEDLKHFKHELFEMLFYVKQLRDCEAFSAEEILRWFEDYHKLRGSGYESIRCSSTAA